MAEDGRVVYKVVIDDSTALADAEKAGQAVGSAVADGAKGSAAELEKSFQDAIRAATSSAAAGSTINITYNARYNDDGIEEEAEETGEDIGEGINRGAEKHAGAFHEIWVGALRRIGAGLVELGAKGVQGFADLTKGALESTAELEQNIGGIETLYKDSAETVIANAQKAYKTAGMSANEYMSTVASVSASLIKATGRGEQQNLEELEAALDEEYLATKRSLEDQYDEVKNHWDQRVKLAGSTAEKDALREQKDAELKALKRANEDQLAAAKAHNKELLAEAEAANNASVTTAESLSEAAAAADQAIIDMADNANRTGTSLESIQAAYAGFAKGQYQLLDNLKLGYGGTQGEMEKLLADAEKITGVHYDISNLSDVYSAIHVIQTELGYTGATAEEAEGTIAGSMASAKAAFDNFLNGSGSAQDFAVAVIGAAKNVAKNLAPIIENFAEGLPALVTELGEQIPEILMATGPPLLDALSGILFALLGLILDNAPAMIEGGMDLIFALADGLVANVPLILEAAVTIIGLLLESLAGHLPDLVTTGINLIINLASGLINAIPILIGMIPEIISSLLSSLLAHIPDLLLAGFKLAVEIGKGLINAIPTLLGMLPELITAILNAFFETDWLEIGYNIVSGIWDGICSLWDTFISNVKGLFGGLLDFVGGILGISSPSKEFAYFGRMSDEGMIAGIEAGEDEMTRTVRRVYTGVADSAEDSILNRGNIEASVSHTFAATARTPDTEITVPLYMDGREVARASAWYTGEQLAWEEM